MSLINDIENILMDAEVDSFECSLSGTAVEEFTKVKFDRVGDLIIEIDIPDDKIGEYISPEVMKDWLEAKGYLE